jgi:CheY-like chemotaxis protein
MSVTTPLDQYQAALVVPEPHRASLAAALHPLESATPRLRSVAIFAGLDVPLVALLDFDGPEPALDALVLELDATVHRLNSAPSRDAIAELIHLRPISATGGAVHAMKEVDKTIAVADTISLVYQHQEPFFTAWARAVAEFGLRVDGPRPSNPVAKVIFTIAGVRHPPCVARVLPPRPTSTPAYFLDVAPNAGLLALLDKRSRERRQGRAQNTPPPGVLRAAPRFDVMLEAKIVELADLHQQWVTDLSHGGMFVCCLNPPELRTRLGVKLVLPQGEELVIAAEVVHRILSGSRPGVGVQFTDNRPEVLAPIHALLAEYQRRTPRVLVVDDEAIWRSTLARVVQSLGAQVQLAADGHEGLIALIDGYFDLDLVILDLHMPHLDGKALLERIRRQGGDQALRVFLFSAASPDELNGLARPGLATGVFSKLDSIDVLTARIAKELRVPLPSQRRAA